MAQGQAVKGSHVVWDCSVAGLSEPPMMYSTAMRLRCLHCGQVFDVPAGCTLRMGSAIGKQYLREHKRCPPLLPMRNELLAVLAYRAFQLGAKP